MKMLRKLTKCIDFGKNVCYNIENLTEPTKKNKKQQIGGGKELRKLYF